MRPESAKWDQISYLGPIFEKTFFAPPFPAIPSLVNGQEWCLPFSFNYNTLTVRYVIPPDIEPDCQP